MIITLNIAHHILLFFLVFARVGSCFSLLPGMGDIYIPMHIRLGFGFMASVGVFFPISATFNVRNMNEMNTALLLLSEISIGMLLGLAVHVTLQCAKFMGSILSMQSGLSMSMMFDSSAKQQVDSFGALLTLFCTATLFALDGHLYILESVVKSYNNIEIGAFFANIQDYTTLLIDVLEATFLFGISISMPFITLFSAIYIASGIVSKILPFMQSFLILTPLQILSIIGALSFTISNLAQIFANYFVHNILLLF